MLFVTHLTHTMHAGCGDGVCVSVESCTSCSQEMVDCIWCEMDCCPNTTTSADIKVLVFVFTPTTFVLIVILIVVVVSILPQCCSILYEGLRTRVG